MSALAHRLSYAALGVALLASSACARGADAERVKSDLQQRLDRDVKADLLRVVAIKREGSAPMPAGESGASRVIVYFNATMELTQPYKFGSWDELGSSSVAYAVGATEKGLFGLQPENKAGDRIRAYGSALYEQSGDGSWCPSRRPTRPAGKPMPPTRRTSRAARRRRDPSS